MAPSVVPLTWGDAPVTTSRLSAVDLDFFFLEPAFGGALRSKSKHLRQVMFRKDVSWCWCFFVLKWLVAGFGFGGGESCDIRKVMKYA
jgi:hypothetical protein